VFSKKRAYFYPTAIQKISSICRMRDVRRLRWLNWSACRTVYLAIPLWSTYSQHTLLSNGENRLVTKPAATPLTNACETKALCPGPFPTPRRTTAKTHCSDIILCGSPCLIRRLHALHCAVSIRFEFFFSCRCRRTNFFYGYNLKRQKSKKKCGNM
jgi:hypothetical protein